MLNTTLCDKGCLVTCCKVVDSLCTLVSTVKILLFHLDVRIIMLFQMVLTRCKIYQNDRYNNLLKMTLHFYFFAQYL
jgi:hypothetical protein